MTQAAAEIDRLLAALTAAEVALSFFAEMPQFAMCVDHRDGAEHDPTGVHAALDGVRVALGKAKGETK